MTKVGLIKFLLIIFVVPTLQAQKVKYKDIFGLLSSKQYEKAEPFLKKYLNENDDNPNAFLFMGIIYQEKSLKNDILKQLPVLVKNTDSAVYFFNKAKSTITEKEIKRNDEYYQAYNRRDLRTGEFGVKISDIQFDLEKKIEGLQERMERIKMTNYYFNIADTLYTKSNSLYRSLQQPYSSLNEFYLRSSDSSVTQLNNLIVRFDSTVKFTENYIASVQNVSSTSYRPTVKLESISDFKTDGIELSDFYQNELLLWNYKAFAIQAKEVIQNEILPLREHLVSFDMELNKLGERLIADSVSVRSDITRLTEKLLSSQLKKFDADPLPLNVFSMKMADLEYRSVVLEDQPLCDSVDVHLQLALARKERMYLNKLDSLSGKIAEENLDVSSTDYQHFVTNAYNNPLVLKNYAKGLKEFADREIKKSDKKLEDREDALRWLVVDSVTVPLFVDSVGSVYNPLVIKDESYTLGLNYTDTTHVAGYFYSINSSRRPDIKITFPVDTTNFKKRHSNSLKALSSDSNNQIYYVLIYSDAPVNGKHPSTIAKIYRSDGLSWANNLELNFLPSQMEYKQDTGELWVKSESETLILDKNGKVK